MVRLADARVVQSASTCVFAAALSPSTSGVRESTAAPPGNVTNPYALASFQSSTRAFALAIQLAATCASISSLSAVTLGVTVATVATTLSYNVPLLESVHVAIAAFTSRTCRALISFSTSVFNRGTFWFHDFTSRSCAPVMLPSPFATTSS